MTEKYQTKQEPRYNPLDENMVKKIIDYANHFSMSPEVKKSILEANERALKEGGVE